MKKNNFIRHLLFFYMTVGVIGIAWRIAQVREDAFDIFDETEYIMETTETDTDETAKSGGKSKTESERAAENALELETEFESEIELTSETETDDFAPDEWISRIDDFLSRVNEIETDTSNSETTADDSAIFAREKSTAVIIDTDFASDADDVIAVRLAMCFQDLGLADIRGIALSTTYSRTPLAVHALCRQDGYGGIPVAMDTSGDGVQVHTDYVDAMYEMPKSRDDYEQPVPMYRRILAESDTKVNIITLGFLQNIQGLMNSAPDRYTQLTGMELIAQKVDTIYIVGGNSTKKPSFNFYWTGEKVTEAARAVVHDFPARIVFLQTDLSDDTYCGQFYSTKDFWQRDIVTKALRANRQESGVVAWDVFSVWCAVQDMNGNSEQAFLRLEQGTQYVSATGATEWTPDETGRHFKMYKNVEGAYYSEIMNNMLLKKYNETHMQ